MERPLRFLHLEDDPNDLELVRATLEAEGLVCDVEAASSRDDFNAALERGGYDLILSDFALPDFDGLSALRMAREKAPEIPFILVSGAMGEEAAIESLQSGATDYVLKHRLSRLVPAVRRTLRESEEHAKRRQAEEALQTERKQLEGQLRQAQKMEAVGLLAGGVAHDFNNLLGVILGYSELLLARVQTDGVVRAKIEEIRRAAERAASLTRQLLAFSRKQVMERRVLDLNALLVEMEKMLRRLISEDIELITRTGEGLGRIKADPGQIEQILMNLVVNARDAMPQGGTLTLETANVQLDEVFARQHVGSRPGSYVMLVVSDTGIGMSSEIQARIFEPFFTTKGMGKGTGLGLATVYGIVKQNEGYIDVYSEPGRGSTFKVYVPRVGDIAERVALRAEDVPPRGTETVLLVEDETHVRAMIRESLEGYGYTILETGDPEEAVRICEKHEKPVHLLMTDVILPRQSGRALARRLKSLHPGLKVLYMSGYTDDAIARHGVLEPGVAFLQKPFGLMAMARKVRDVLNSAGTGVA